LFCLAVFAFSGISMFSQPNYKIENPSVNLQNDAGDFENAAKDNVKNEKHRKDNAGNLALEYYRSNGILNAAHGLSIAEKKNAIDDLQEILRLHYQNVVNTNLSLIEELKSSTAEFKDDNTVTNRARIVNYYRFLVATNRVLANLTPDKFQATKKKSPGLEIKVVDYSAELKAAEALLNESIENAATMHYDRGRELSRNSDIQSNKDAAKAFKFASQYVTNYRDSKDRYEACKKLATTRLGLTSKIKEGLIREASGVSSLVSSNILNAFQNTGDRYEFFQLLSRDELEVVMKEQKLSLSGLLDESTTKDLGGLSGVNALLIVEVVGCNTDRQSLKPVTSEYTREVKLRDEEYTDDKGQKKTRAVMGNVTCRATSYSKSASGSVTISYKIVDVSNGAVIKSNIHSESANWSHKWFKFESGDNRAMPAGSKEEVNYIANQDLLNQAAGNVKNMIVAAVADYAQKVSQ